MKKIIITTLAFIGMFAVGIADEVEQLLNKWEMFTHSKYRKYRVHTPPIFQNPFMAPNNFSEIHNNSYQTDTMSIAGPGRTKSKLVQGVLIDPPFLGIAGTIAFNSSGQIITIRTGALSSTELFNTILVIDPDTLEVLGRTDLPPRAVSSTGVSFAGGGYFFLDNLDRLLCVTSTQEVRIYSQSNNSFTLVQTYNLSSALNNPDDILNSVLPDSSGNLWFISNLATVGFINPNTSSISSISIPSLSGTNPNETNTKSFATDDNGGVYPLTDYALYRFTVGDGGAPELVWRASYDRGLRTKPGQNQQGSGTTPTLFNDFHENQYVTIADNAEPYMHVLVFNRNTGVLIAKQPVFRRLPFKNSCENSLIAVNHSVMIENNYGNIDVKSTSGPLTTEPGFARVDFTPSGHSKVRWTNYKIAVPSIVSGLSTKDGLVYTYAKNRKGWYFAALNYRTGKIVATAPLSRSGDLVDFLGNNFYGGLNIGPNHRVYAGVVGGIVAWHPACESYLLQNKP